MKAQNKSGVGLFKARMQRGRSEWAKGKKWGCEEWGQNSKGPGHIWPDRQTIIRIRGFTEWLSLASCTGASLISAWKTDW